MPARQRTTADIFTASQEWLFQATKYFQPNRVHSFVKGEILPKVRFKTPLSVSTGVWNAPARRLYESVGFTIVNRYLEYVRPA